MITTARCSNCRDRLLPGVAGRPRQRLSILRGAPGYENQRLVIVKQTAPGRTIFRLPVQSKYWNISGMPTIGHIGSFDVMIFRNDHDPPHFHVFSGEFLAKFAIANCALLSGNGRIRRRDIRAVEEWGQKHRAALYLNWDLARGGAPPQKIENNPDALRDHRSRSPS